MNSTRCLGSKVALFLRKSPQNICGFSKKNRNSEKFKRIFPRKKGHFRPEKTSRIQREFGFFFKKCGTFLIRSRQFSCRNDYLGDLPAPLEELQPPDEENTTFFEKNPDFLLKAGCRNWLKIRYFFRFLGTPAGSWDDLPTWCLLHSAYPRPGACYPRAPQTIQTWGLFYLLLFH